MLRLRGCPALSPFRRDRLLRRLPGVRQRARRVPALRLAGAASSTRPSESCWRSCSIMVRGVSESPAPGTSELKARSRVVVGPRLGTVSPWASKATDIAHACGLTLVRRIERGVLYTLVTLDVGAAGELTPEQRRVLFDPMTRVLRSRVGTRWSAVRRRRPEPLADVGRARRRPSRARARQRRARARARHRRDRLPGRRAFGGSVATRPTSS